jgi:hypothetical protein
LIGRFTRCLIKIFTKKAMLYSETDIDAGQVKQTKVVTKGLDLQDREMQRQRVEAL